MPSIEERIKSCIERHPDWPNRKIRNSLGVRDAEIDAARGGGPMSTGAAGPSSLPLKTPELAPGPIPPGGGFSLRGIRLLSKKPTDFMKARIYSLRRGMGYKIEDLSKQWGVSTETLRKHAKDHKALVYVEATPGEYVACIVHPETPKGE